MRRCTLKFFLILNWIPLNVICYDLLKPPLASHTIDLRRLKVKEQKSQKIKGTFNDERVNKNEVSKKGRPKSRKSSKKSEK